MSGEIFEMIEIVLSSWFFPTRIIFIQWEVVDDASDKWYRHYRNFPHNVISKSKLLLKWTNWLEGKRRIFPVPTVVKKFKIWLCNCRYEFVVNSENDKFYTFKTIITYIFFFFWKNSFFNYPFQRPKLRSIVPFGVHQGIGCNQSKMHSGNSSPNHAPPRLEWHCGSRRDWMPPDKTVNLSGGVEFHRSTIRRRSLNSAEEFWCCASPMSSAVIPRISVNHPASTADLFPLPMAMEPTLVTPTLREPRTATRPAPDSTGSGRGSRCRLGSLPRTAHPINPTGKLQFRFQLGRPEPRIVLLGRHQQPKFETESMRLEGLMRV